MCGPAVLPCPVLPTLASLATLAARATPPVLLAALIVTLHSKEAFQDLPAKTGMSRRRLYYLLEVGQFIGKWGLSKVEAEQVGWTKLQIVARHVQQSGGTVKDVARHVELATRTRAYVLAQALGGHDPAAKYAVVFRLSAEAKTELTEALVANGAKRGPRGLSQKAEALMGIVRALEHGKL